LAAGKVGDGALAAAGIPGSTGQNVQYIYKYNINTWFNCKNNICFIHKKTKCISIYVAVEGKVKNEYSAESTNYIKCIPG
jgi:hypothetical protein